MNKRKRINLLQNDIDDSDGEEIQEVSYHTYQQTFWNTKLKTTN